ncbi:hypothetical protein T05_9944 [Trichinella murrelli]|uniref:Uncharacterized protein n=1 Tax=Trichinella murrelli TaxID=144512 RepID=A0A0V0TZU4_9BILA|nr:hypothetical protein T05_9944 [Trichinella murrelli]
MTNMGCEYTYKQWLNLFHFFNISISWLLWHSVYKFRNGLFPCYRCIAHLSHDLLVVVKWKFLFYTFSWF